MEANDSTVKGDILVIDDTPENLTLLSNMLTERGYKVRSVTKGSAGLRGARAAPPDLILLDIRMPEMDGYRVCAELKADDRTREIPVIFLSALGEAIDKVKAFQSGGVDYITKPFQVEEVLARIRTHLHLRDLQKQLQLQNVRLRAEREKFSKIFRSSPSPIAILTRSERRFLEINSSFPDLTGYTRGEILDRALEELKIEREIGSYEKLVRELQLSVPVQNHEFTLRTKSGETRTVLLSIEAIELEGIPCTLNIIHDITEYKRLENQFISLVSHELRTPMNSLIGSLDLLKTGQLGTLTERGQKILEIAIANTERLIRLVNDVLDLERMKAGQLSLEKRENDISGILLASIESVQSLADRAGISLRCEAVPVTLPVDGDRLVQAITNLLANAIKFSEPGQTVWTRAEIEGEYVRIEVRDNGRGIPSDRLARVFEPFQQVDASDSRQKGGTGLGLAICRDIIDRHDGRIWVESALGEGSTFYILLPLSY